MRPRLNAGDDDTTGRVYTLDELASMRPRLNAGDDLRQDVTQVLEAYELQ